MQLALLVWFLLLHTCIARWPCPGKCWTAPDETQMQPWYLDLWEIGCARCFETNGCGYGTYYDNRGCNECAYEWENMKVWNVIMTGQNADMIRDCSLDNSICKKGYFPYSKGPEDRGVCLECFSLSFDCGKGKFMKRCITLQEETLNSDDYCNVCDYPALPNATIYRYGFGKVYDDCSTYDENTLAKLGPSSCAWFLTPKWNTGRCSIECNFGYVPVSLGLSYPECTRCNTTCPPGWKPPICLGGDKPIAGKNGACEKCTDVLPPNARWQQDRDSCLWECTAEGYYKHEETCSQCEVLFVCPDGYNFMGCNGNNPGQCVECSVLNCPSKSFYLKTDIFMDQCACVGCTNPVLGSSYLVKNCSERSDAIIAKCTNGCQVSGYFLTKSCTLWSDTVCAKCSSPPTAGLLLISECTFDKDAVYGPCKSGMACNGSAIAFKCPPAKIAVGGLCVCRPATVLSTTSGECEPIQCLSGMYPDSVSGNCLNCTADGLFSLTREGVLGLSACGCPPGFFVENLFSSIKCWPCGDLGCIRGLQRQSECLGFEQAEPTCNCAPAPATQLVDSEDFDNMCSLRCANGYHSNNNNIAFLPGLYDQFSFLEISGQATQVSTSKPIFMNNNNIQDIVLVDKNTAAALSGDGKLCIAHLDSGTVEEINLEMFIYGFLRKQFGSVTAILTHEEGFLWIAFTYWGLCEDVDTTSERDCSALELISFSSSSCASGICMTSQIWGNLFPSSGTSRRIQAMSSDSSGFLYMALGNHDNVGADTLIRYKLEFYQASKPLDERQPDYPLEIIGQLDSILDISFGVGGIYTLTANMLVCFILESKTWVNVMNATNYDKKGQITQLSQHLLAVQFEQSLQMVDLLNQIIAPFPSATFLKIAFRNNMLVSTNGSLIKIYSSAKPCPVDTLVYADKKVEGCVPMQCLLSEPCGPNSIRKFGDTICSCKPGYFVSGDVCLECPSEFYYCPGGRLALQCPENSMTHFQLAASISECLCSPGFYHFGSYCLPCPTNMWCPANGTTTPIPCYAQGTTLVEGSSSPLDCICPPRTHGLLCEACKDSEDCIPIERSLFGVVSNPVPTLASVNVKGWGPIWGEEIANECLSYAIMTGNFLIYSILGIDSFALQPGGADSLTWNWIFVLRDPMPEIYNNMSICLSDHGFTLERVQPLSTAKGNTLRIPSSCGGRNWEWSGMVNSPCTCVAGYEALITSTWGSQCFPCLKGTFRERRSTKGCIPCAGEYENAPYLGMKECECIEGYKRSSSTGMCIDAKEYPPSWYSDLSSPTIVITLVVIGGGVIILVSIMIAIYF